MRTITFVVVAVFLTGCTQRITSAHDHQALAVSMFDAFNRHDWKKMASHYANDAEFLDPSLGKTYVRQSREATVAKYAGMQQLFPDIRDDISAVHAAGESVIVQFTSYGAMADGTTFELPIVTVLTFRDGFIVRDATYYDLENP
jgi:ketosteroid isomerase-like protein